MFRLCSSDLFQLKLVDLSDRLLVSHQFCFHLIKYELGHARHVFFYLYTNETKKLIIQPILLIRTLSLESTALHLAI